MAEHKNAVAIITARGGSKRIPKKNIKPFLGKPIIAYSIETALSSGLFDEVMVSTDDQEIAAVALQYGAKIPFMRSANSSSDHATTADALIEVLDAYRTQGVNFSYGCCLYPTAPFISVEKLRNAHSLLIEKELDSVFPIMKFGYPIWRSLKEENGLVSMNWPENLNARSQDLPPAYHDAGQFYFFSTEMLLREKRMFANKSAGIVISELEGQDIDSETDWQLAELKYKLLNTPKNG